MQQSLFKFVSVMAFLWLSPPLLASPQDLIQRLYHADFSKEDDDEDAPAFTMNGELGILVATGNTAAASVKAAINADHEMDDWSNSYNAELLYKESDVNESDRAVTAQRFYTTAQFDYKLRQPNRRLFLYADYENDRFNGYDYRASLAGGWSQRLWQETHSEFRYSVGPGYAFISAEDPSVTAVNSGVVVRASAEYRYKWNSGARFRQFISTEAGTDNARSRAETSLSASIFDALAMKISLILIHETDAAPDNASLSSETSVSLVYQFF